MFKNNSYGRLFNLLCNCWNFYQKAKKLAKSVSNWLLICILFVCKNCKCEIWRCQILWRILVEDASLLSQLRVIKDFYLLGRGELYLAFIDQAQHLLRVPPTPTTQYGTHHLCYSYSIPNVCIQTLGIARKSSVWQNILWLDWRERKFVKMFWYGMNIRFQNFVIIEQLRNIAFH